MPIRQRAARSTDPMKYSKEMEVACKAIREASETYIHRKSEVKIKENSSGAYDVVTKNDVLIEDYIKKAIHEAFPKDSFLCEESGECISSDRVWVIDPIDGTVNYAHNIPLYGIQLALMIKDEGVMAVIYLPEFDEMYTAEKGCGAYLNGKKLNVRNDVSMHDTIVSTSDYSRGSAKYRAGQLKFMELLHDKVARFKMFGCACCDFAYFASGRTECHIRYVRKLWDFLPGLLIAIEAGGVYDHELYDKYKFLIMCSSEKALKDISAVLKNGMEF